MSMDQTLLNPWIVELAEALWAGKSKPYLKCIPIPVNINLFSFMVEGVQYNQLIVMTTKWLVSLFKEWWHIKGSALSLLLAV